LTNHETPNTSAADAEKRPATIEQNEPIAETHGKGANKDVLITPDGQKIDLGITGTMKLDPPGRLAYQVPGSAQSGVAPRVGLRGWPCVGHQILSLAPRRLDRFCLS
jgi:hypothetical protein